MAQAKDKKTTTTRTQIIQQPAPKVTVVAGAKDLAKRGARRGASLAKRAADQNKQELIGAGAAYLLGMLENKGVIPATPIATIVAGGVGMAAGSVIRNDMIKAAGGGLLAVGAYKFAKGGAGGVSGDLLGDDGLSGDLY